MKPPVPLVAEPADPTADVGPRHRGGPLTLFVAIFCVFSAAGAVLLLWRDGYRHEAFLGALFFGAAALWAGWCLIEHFRHHALLPRSHALLTGALAFDIRSTCRDVAATVFFDPDSLVPGAPAQLLCFVENYASRRRTARFRIGPHPGLGLHQEHDVSLHLAAGQAAVYALPLVVAPALAAGEHDLPITLQMDKPAGTGVRLPGARRHLYDLWTVHFAVPFTLTPAAGGSPAPTAHRPGKPRFLTLASVSESKPRLDVLQALVTGNLRHSS
jgi:hypothetical protein